MEKFEHLFSIDPIGAFEKIESDYKRYFEAAFKLSDEKLNKERIEKLSENSNTSKEPYLELLPEYKQDGNLRSFDDLAQMFKDSFGGKEVALEYFKDFIAKGLMSGLMDKFYPYGHQIEMMRKAFSGKGEDDQDLLYKNTLITSGTGSGKTESFLLPLLADIFKEAQTQEWPSANKHDNWYLPQDGIYEPCQRKGDTRPAAVRALVLYPMNALVEDQMARLRKTLDCDDVRGFMDNQLHGNRIYFGSYNGSTIAKKSHKLLEELADNDDEWLNRFNKIKRGVADRLNKYASDFKENCEYVIKNPDKEEALYISPRLGGQRHTAEMVTRWDMQECPPDILITNTSMLSIMLMRKAEEDILTKTRDWLKAEDVPEEQREAAKKDRIFHIVVDELHLYRGTAGSEVACLLRMLYNALELDPVVNGRPNPQIKILASSASLGDGEATEKFLEEFFGLYSDNGEPVFNVQRGDNYTGENKNLIIDYSKFDYFTPKNFVNLDADTDKLQDEEVKNNRIGIINHFVKSQDQFECNNIDEFVFKYQEQIFWDFYQIMPTNTDGSKQPIAQSELQKKLFNNKLEALRGFLIFRGFIDEIDSLKKKHKLPRFRFHNFFKYIEGLWGELQPTVEKGNAPVGNLSYIAEEVGPNKRKMLELLRCENCGQLFIGGNRKKTNGEIYLTLNYPSLDQIPNFNPTPMVQNKNYSSYAIFWPHSHDCSITLTSGDVKQGAEDHVLRINDGNSRYENGQVEWIPGFLDSITGRFVDQNEAMVGEGDNYCLDEDIRQHGIQGYLYRVVTHNTHEELNFSNGSKILAAPCTCPYCHQNYINRKYTNSPIRSFRTGIDRSNQILSKELLYQLDEKSAKLVGFSDSREDAAKQALGIEKEHYRDMVRMLFVECVDEYIKQIDDIYEFVVEKKGQGLQPNDIIPQAEQRWVYHRLNEIVQASFWGGETALDSFRMENIPLSHLFGANIDVFNGTLVRKLLKEGINPAGEAYKFQWYPKANRLIHWSEAYEFSNATLINVLDEDSKRQIRTQLKNAVFANSFGKYMGVSTLDAGIGYICSKRSPEIEQSPYYRNLRNILPNEFNVYDFIDAFIRVLGDNYYYPSDEGGEDAYEYRTRRGQQGGLKRAVRTAISTFSEKHNIDEDTLGNATVNFIKRYCSEDTPQNDGNLQNIRITLGLEKLSFQKMTKDMYLRCPTCGRVHPNLGFGFCTNTSCTADLREDVTIETDELHKHYISFDILEERKKPRRLHTEELTGQTDDIQTRLREFKGILLDDSEAAKKTKEIDMVCVTTTMEVGVDIGSLQAIFQGNMPPTRYNYQQRVGRGGRRGQAYSTAFTFCRGRSHDVYYYNKATDEMVGGIPATPKLSLAPYHEGNQTKMKMAIMKRVIVKELLHQAYLDLPYNPDLIDTSGEFGTIGEWKYGEETTKTRLNNWIQSHSSDIDNIVLRYLNQFNKDECILGDINYLIRWIKNDMVGQIDNVVKKTSMLSMGLAKYLTENGFLPMYGMPSDSRNFYHGFDVENKKVRSIDRSTEMAVSEFAPGSEKTKDKGKYRVEAITVPIKEEVGYNDTLDFYDKEGNALADHYIITYNQEKEITNIQEPDSNTQNNQLQDNEHLIVIPQAYRSLEIKNNTGTPVENNDKGSSFVQCQLFAKDNSSVEEKPKFVGNNAKISLYELGFSDDPTVWHVNDNNGNFYTGDFTARGLGMPCGGQTIFAFYEKNGDEVKRKQIGMSIALGSKKVTEMVKIELNTWPDTLNLSLNTGNRSAIRAAFYSAAFLLQRALADRLDVDPDEIEITEKIVDEDRPPVIYLSDALANGAGIVSYLYQDNQDGKSHLEELINKIVSFNTFDEAKTPKDKCFMQSLLSHRDNCLTACQECLLSYNNRGYHHVLDWRMGVGILRLMINKDYDFGFDETKRDQYEELKDYEEIIKACATKLRFNKPNSYFEDHTKQEGVDDVIERRVIYHPLWNTEKVSEKICVLGGEFNNIKLYNSFKVLRSDMVEDKTVDRVSQKGNGVDDTGDEVIDLLP